MNGWLASGINGSSASGMNGSSVVGDLMEKQLNGGLASPRRDDDYFEEFPDDMVDTSHIFTGYSFKSCEELISETRRIGLLHDIHIRLYTYFDDRGFGEQWLWCDRSRPYQYRSDINAPSSKYLTGTKKCLCPFRLKGIAQSDGTWKLFVHNGVHNHKLIEKDEILNDEVKVIILRMTASQVPVANILIELANQNYKVTKKQVYNVRAREKMKVRENRTSSEQLLKFAADHGYIHFHQTIPGKKKGTRELTDVLFAHPDSIILLKHYPFVLLADCTYQTNKYKMPLLEIIGVTPVNKNFSVFYGFLENEKETAYDWAFKCVREVLDTDEKIVFVTDREKALINVIEKYFPNAIHLLCRRHIEKDVEAWVKKVSGKGSTGETFAKGRWKNLVNSATEAEYVENEKILFEKYHFIPGLEKYLKKTWLEPYKERFVSAWINKILHFGNVTTNRVESAHASLKKLLKTAVGGFDTVFESINNSVKLQIREIVRELGRSRIVRLHVGVALNVYQRLNLNVSHHAIRTLDLAVQKPECNNCVMRTTHGLPCACELIKLLDTDCCVELDSVHQFWKTLDIKTSVKEGVAEKEVQEEERLRKLVDEVIKGGVQSMKKVSEYIENMLHPPNIVDPEVKKTKGRPKKTSVSRTPSHWEHVEKEFPTQSSKSRTSKKSVGKEKEIPKRVPKRGRSNGSVAKEKELPRRNRSPFPWQKELHDIMVPWVIDWLNVIGDGNCGFRSIAYDIYGDENEWLKVRHDLLGELKDNKEFYTDLFAGDRPFNNLCNRVSYECGPFNRNKWFDTELLFVAANYYDAIFVNLSSSQNATYLPTKAAKVEKSGAKQIFSMVYLGPEEHFVWVRLGSRSPLPRPYPMGHFLYLNQIQDRIALYPPQVSPKSSNKETPIVFDDL